MNTRHIAEIELRVLSALPLDGWCGHMLVAERAGVESGAKTIRALNALERRGLVESVGMLWHLTPGGKAFFEDQQTAMFNDQCDGLPETKSSSGQ